jgi:hypothetical protein
MSKLVCAACQAFLSMGLWDKHTERWHCIDCLPPLGSLKERMRPVKPLLKAQSADPATDQTGTHDE